MEDFAGMDSLLRAALGAVESLKGKTLASLRDEAAQESSGICFAAVRRGRERVLVVFCLVGAERIAQIEPLFEFDDDGPTLDWAAATLLEVAAPVALRQGNLSLALRDEMNRRNALVLISADPDSIRTLERLFAFPP